jgi:transposase
MGRKKKHIELSESERVTLREGSKHHSKFEFRLRCQAILLNHSGLGQYEVAHHLGVTTVTVFNWFSCWNKHGLMGLLRKKGQGRKQILSINNEQHLTLLASIVKKHNQSIKAIQSEFVKELSLPMSTDTVKRFLKKTILAGDEYVVAPIRVKTKQII